MTARARAGGRAARAAPVDRAAMERAIEAFLQAVGAPRGDPELEHTPRRVAAAWADEFLDGYQVDPAVALGSPAPAPAGGGLVLLTHIDFTGVCPHHLLPYRGVAHLAYRPAGFVAGLGRLASLVDAYAHRLVLQEALARDLAEALVRLLRARWAAVVVEGEHLCMTLRGERRPRSRTVVEAVAGRVEPHGLERLWDAVLAAEGARRAAGRRAARREEPVEEDLP